MFHFLRPEWFLLLLPWLLVLLLGLKQRRANSGWSNIVDKRLLPHLLENQMSSGRRYSLVLWGLLALLLIIALAGPTWSKRSLPAFQQQSALVVLFDLSMSMNTEDIKPSRIAQARLKLIDLLQRRNEGQTALVVYAASAFTVTPLTDDSKTIQALVSTLSPGMMPAQGSRADLAIEKALDLLSNAGVVQGDILLMTDGIDSDVRGAIGRVDIGNNRLSILAVGSEEGAPIPGAEGGFVKDEAGSIVVSRTDFDSLRSVAMQQGGMFSRLTLDNRDLDALDMLLQSRQFQNDHQQSEYETENWIEQGPWLLLLVTPLAALAFRRGFILPVLIASITIATPQESYAQEDATTAEFSLWDRLWNNRDQLGQQAMQQGATEQAAELFNQSDWKAGAHYQAGHYDKALELWQDASTTEELYNRANAEARLGQLEKALQSYDEVLAQNPEHEDAAYNRSLVDQALQQQKQQEPQSDNSGQQDSDQQSDQNQQQEQGQDQQGDSSSQQESENQQDEDESYQPREDDDRSRQNAQDEQEAEMQQQAQAEENEGDEQEDFASQQSDKEQPMDEAQMADSMPNPTEQELTDQAEAQWLRRVPDDPGGLLRNKFLYQYGRQQNRQEESKPW